MAAFWHLASLDAPLLALLWTALLAAPHHLPGVTLAAIALAVWVLYASDRILDAAHHNDRDRVEDRHRFHGDHRTAFILGIVAISITLVWIVLHLPEPLRLGWPLLGLPLALYFLLIHTTRLRLPKELVVSVFFSAACVLPAATLTGLPLRLTFARAFLFMLLCWTNCIAIARWESGVETHRLHALTRWGAEHFPALIAIVLAVCAGGGLLSLAVTGSVAVAAAATLSVAILWLLDRKRTAISRLGLRVLADAALLTPILFLAHLR